MIRLTKDQLPFRQTYLPVADLISTQRSRLYSSHQIAIEFMEAGTCRPVLIDKDNRIVNGHHRVDAAKILGFAAIRAIQFTEHTREDYLKLKDEIELQSGEEIDLELPVEYDPNFFATKPSI